MNQRFIRGKIIEPVINQPDSGANTVKSIALNCVIKTPEGQNIFLDDLGGKVWLKSLPVDVAQMSR